MNPISVRSWHYRLVFYVMGRWYFQKYVKDNENFGVKIVPKNITLCKYFWSVALCCGIFYNMVLLKEVCVPVYDFLDALYHKRPIKIKLPDISLNPTLVRILAGGIMFGAAVMYFLRDDYFMMSFQLALGVFLISTPIIVKYVAKRKRLKFKFEKDKTKPKHHNLALEYIKARKGKYCPVLQFYTPIDDAELR